MAEIKVTQENFEQEVIKSSIPVLLDFWATWCGPCSMLSPILAEIAEEREGQLKVGKVNVDEQFELASAFHVASIPMLVMMKDGKPVASMIGYRPKEDVEAFIDEN